MQALLAEADLFRGFQSSHLLPPGVETLAALFQQESVECGRVGETAVLAGRQGAGQKQEVDGEDRTVGWHGRAPRIRTRRGL
jgi:hypothetical protein